jgi:ribosome-associated protein
MKKLKIRLQEGREYFGDIAGYTGEYDDSEDIDADPSKSQLKKEMQHLQQLGARLVSLSKDQLKKSELGEMLLGAILEAQKLTAHEAIRRQKQYIGKLMRNLDEEEIKYIEELFNIIDGKSEQQKAMTHMIETMRTDLINHDEKLTKFIESYPNADIQVFRNTIRNARKEIQNNTSEININTSTSNKNYKQLFSMIKEVILT